MSVLQQAKAKYKAQLGNDLLSVELPDYELTVYFRPVTNLMQQQKVIELHQQGKIVEALVETVITRALDADGKKMFSSADRDELLREVNPDFVIQIATAINNNGEVPADLGN